MAKMVSIWPKNNLLEWLGILIGANFVIVINRGRGIVTAYFAPSAQQLSIMRTRPWTSFSALVLAALPLVAAAQQVQTGATPSTGVAVTRAPESTSNTEPSIYHAGPWEQEIGYAQALRVGNTIYISGTTGTDENGNPADLESQMKLAYAGIRKTLAHYGADLKNIVMERIHTTDMEALIKAQETRKAIYAGWFPPATWTEVKRLYEKAAKIEIDVEARIDLH